MSPLTSPPLPSLWSATTPPPPPTQPLDGPLVADVVIVGAGYTGLSTALHLAEAGKRVVVLEAQEIGHGGSGRNNGMVIPAFARTYPEDLRARFGTDRGNRFAQLMAGSATETFTLIRRLGIECEAVQGGWTQPAHSPGRAVLSRRRFEQWQDLGADVEYLDAQGIQQRSGSPLYHAAWVTRSGGHVNPLKLVYGLAGAAIKAGAQIHTHSRVLSVRNEHGGWRATTAQGSVQTARIIVATNAYSDSLFPQLRRSFVPVRSCQMATAPLPPDQIQDILKGGLALSDTHGDMYFVRPTKDNRLVSGGKLFFDYNWQDRLARRVHERLRRLFPTLGSDIRFDYIWNGDVAITPDFIPRLNQLAPGILSVAGYSGRGVALSITTGRILADFAGSLRDAQDLDIPLTPVNPIPLHGLVKRLAKLELLRYRWNDRREPRS